MGPGLLETIFGFCREVVLPLGLEALDQSNQRPAVVWMPQKIRAIDRFRFGWAMGR